MYKILTDQNKLLGYVSQPNYIKVTPGGYVPCAPVEAVGLTYQGTVYNLLGHSEIEGAPTAYASMVTDGEMLQIANAKNSQTVNGMESLLGHEQTRQEALELRRALQLFVQSTVPVDDESKAMEYASIYPTWEELLATKQTYPAKTIFSWGTTEGGDKQLWSFISDYQPQEIYTPEEDISHYKKVGVTEKGYEVWTQPLCAEDAYRIGDIAYHIDGLWKCTQGDGAGLNVWEPGVFGWERYTPEDPEEPEEPDPEEPVEPSQYPAWEEMTVGTVLHVGDYFTYQGKTYKVLREMTVTPGWEPPALLNDFYEEVVE